MIHQGHVAQLAGIEAVASGASGDYIRRSDILADLRHRRTGQKELDLFGGFVGGKADQLQPGLVEHKMHRRRTFSPVLVHLPGMGICEHYGLYPRRNRAILFQVGPHDAKRHWPG